MVRRAAVVSGCLALAAALALAFLPLHGNGVSGNAVAPTYGEFGWAAYAPLPTHPSLADLRRAGVVVPQDVVNDRRRIVGAVAGLGAVLVLAGLLVRRRRR
jgi:hypothetical protein